VTKINVYINPYIYQQDILQRSNGKRNHWRNRSGRKVRSMHTWGDIPIGGAIIFPMMSKAWKEKYKIDA
jgi:hypothetical protein